MGLSLPRRRVLPFDSVGDAFVSFLRFQPYPLRARAFDTRIKKVSVYVCMAAASTKGIKDRWSERGCGSRMDCPLGGEPDNVLAGLVPGNAVATVAGPVLRLHRCNATVAGRICCQIQRSRWAEMRLDGELILYSCTVRHRRYRGMGRTPTSDCNGEKARPIGLRGVQIADFKTPIDGMSASSMATEKLCGH